MMPFLKTYAVYIKPGDEHPLESSMFVKEGFSMPAFLFSLFWALYHRVWRLAVLVLMFYIVANKALLAGVIDLHFRLIVEMGFLAWVGFQGGEWRAKALERQGFVLLDIVMERSEAGARQRLFDRYLPQYPVVAPSALGVAR